MDCVVSRYGGFEECRVWAYSAAWGTWFVGACDLPEWVGAAAVLRQVSLWTCVPYSECCSVGVGEREDYVVVYGC